MQASGFENISLLDFKQLNEPTKWKAADKILEATTDNKTDFWQGTWYNFHFNSGHVYGVDVQGDFTFTVSKLTKFIVKPL